MLNTLRSARDEIVGLRRRNEVLEARVEVVEVFAAALGLKRGACGMAPDVVWELDKEIASLSTPSASPPNTICPEPE